MSYVERAMSFGPGSRLAGVLTEPRAGSRGPAALLWNVGVNHHVGPYRVYVDLARQLALSGFSSLRFDASGLGDSEVRRDATSETDRAIADLGDACELIKKRTSIDRVVPVGFCSSVDAAHVFASNDDRVAGAIFVEGYTFRTGGFWLRYGRRVFERARWRRLIAHRAPSPVRRMIMGNLTLEGWGEDEIYVREYPTPDRLRDDYRAMLARGRKLMFVYVGGDGNFNHASQLGKMLHAPDLGGQATVVFMRDADHTFFRTDHRRVLVDHVSRWFAARF